MHFDAMRLERTLRLRQQHDRRKGRKGRKLPAPIRRVGFVKDINHLDARCGGRFAPLGAAETGGNWRKPPAETLLEKLSAVSLSHLRGHASAKRLPHYRKYRKFPRLVAGRSDRSRASRLRPG
jgi:hypothetical protein